MVASSLIGATSRLKFLVAIRPGVSSPQFSARMAATFDRLSQGRLLVNVVTGGDPGELEGDGVFVSHDERYAITADYLKIWRGILAASHEGAGYSHDGEKLVSKGGKVLYPPTQKPYPPLYFGGSSEAAHELAAEQLDVYLTWGEPPEAVARKIADVRERAARHGRSVKFGIRLHVIVRETEAAAWAAADELISHLSEDTVNAAQAAFARMDSEGQRRMAALHGGKLDDGRGGRSHLEIAPTCGPAWAWCAAARARPLVGDPQTVAARIQEYAELGIDTFIFRLSAPGRVVPLRRAGVSAAARQGPWPPGQSRADRPVRRGHGHRAGAEGRGQLMSA